MIHRVLSSIIVPGFWYSTVLSIFLYRLGRRMMFLAITLVLAAVTTASAFTDNFLIFASLRFVAGVTDIGFFLVLYTWGKHHFKI